MAKQTVANAYNRRHSDPAAFAEAGEESPRERFFASLRMTEKNSICNSLIRHKLYAYRNTPSPPRR